MSRSLVERERAQADSKITQWCALRALHRLGRLPGTVGRHQPQRWVVMRRNAGSSSPSARKVAERFNISQTAVYDWGRQGLIKKCYSDTLNRGLWEVPRGKTIIKGCGGRGARPARLVACTT
jgi:hypothetical protein